MQSILIGIAHAIAVKKHGWKPSWEDAMLNSVLEQTCKAIIKFSDLLATPSRKVLDLTNVPQVRIVHTVTFDYFNIKEYVGNSDVSEPS